MLDGVEEPVGVIVAAVAVILGEPGFGAVWRFEDDVEVTTVGVADVEDDVDALDR